MEEMVEEWLVGAAMELVGMVWAAVAMKPVVASVTAVRARVAVARARVAVVRAAGRARAVTKAEVAERHSSSCAFLPCCECNET